MGRIRLYIHVLLCSFFVHVNIVSADGNDVENQIVTQLSAQAPIVAFFITDTICPTSPINFKAHHGTSPLDGQENQVNNGSPVNHLLHCASCQDLARSYLVRSLSESAAFNSSDDLSAMTHNKLTFAALVVNNVRHDTTPVKANVFAALPVNLCHDTTPVKAAFPSIPFLICHGTTPVTPVKK